MIVVVGTYYQAGGVAEVIKIADNNNRLEFWKYEDLFLHNIYCSVGQTMRREKMLVRCGKFLNI